MSFEHFLIQLLNGLHRPRSQRPGDRDLILGKAQTPNRSEIVILPEALRPQHLGILGLSGVGKTYFMENLIRQDIDHGTGFVVFDVHGDLADRIVDYLAERADHAPEILDTTILIEPFDQSYSVGFNPLEKAPHTSPFVQTQQLAHILRSRWETETFGPRTEELLQNALYVLSAHNLTLLELPHLLINKVFREGLIDSLSESAITDYWRGRYEPLSEAMKATVREPLLIRVSRFLSDPQIREITGQQQSTFTFSDAIARGLRVVVNLSKGKLGENSSVLGSLLFTKLELEVMAQAQVRESERKLFAIYADELQNFVGDNFATLIAEARKYRVAITAGHQFWRQLPPAMRAAMLSVGSRVFFRLHYHDAVQLAGELEPTEKQWYATLLTRLPRGGALFRSGPDRPIPFAVEKHIDARPTAVKVARLRDRSRSLYATPRSNIREEIERRYHQEIREYTARHLGRPPLDGPPSPPYATNV